MCLHWTLVHHYIDLKIKLIEIDCPRLLIRENRSTLALTKSLKCFLSKFSSKNTSILFDLFFTSCTINVFLLISSDLSSLTAWFLNGKIIKTFIPELILKTFHLNIHLNFLSVRLLFFPAWKLNTSSFIWNLSHGTFSFDVIEFPSGRFLIAGWYWEV